MDTITSATLLEGLKDLRNSLAWQRFTDRYRPLVVAFAHKLGLNDSDAQDAAQETMMAFAKGYQSGDYDPAKGRLRNWLFGVAHRKIVDVYRRRGGEVVVSNRTGTTGFMASVEAPDEAEAVWEQEWRQAVLQESLNEVAKHVSPNTVEAFRLSVLEDLPAEEVAKRLDMKENAVYAAKHRVMTRLREVMAQMEQIW